MEFPARLSNGITLSCVARGDADGVPVLLLHGFTDSWRSYEPVLPFLPRSLRVFALSQRGHGDSDRPAAGYRTRDFAADAARFLDAAGIERAIVVGHSMGATNALRLALDFPDRVRGVVLAGAFAGFRHNEAVMQFWRESVSQLADPIDPAFVRDFQLSTLSQGVRTAFLDTVVAESLKVPARVWREAFLGLLEDDAADHLFNVRAPVEILWGARDAFSPRADQETLLAALRPSRLTVYERAGHALHWEEPERFAQDLVRFAKAWTAAADSSHATPIRLQARESAPPSPPAR